VCCDDGVRKDKILRRILQISSKKFVSEQHEDRIAIAEDDELSCIFDDMAPATVDVAKKRARPTRRATSATLRRTIPPSATARALNSWMIHWSGETTASMVVINRLPFGQGFRTM
jgi:hypothetical protein